MRKHLVLFAAAALFLSVPTGEAQAQFRAGPQIVLWDFDELGIGGRADFALGDALGVDEGVFQTLFGSVNVNYLLDTGDVTFLVFNVLGAVTFETDAAVTPYAGLGINLVRTSISEASNTSSGLNLTGGLFFDLGPVPAYVDLGYWTTGAGGLTASLGVLFGG